MVLDYGSVVTSARITIYNWNSPRPLGMNAVQHHFFFFVFQGSPNQNILFTFIIFSSVIQLDIFGLSSLSQLFSSVDLLAPSVSIARLDGSTPILSPANATHLYDRLPAGMLFAISLRRSAAHSVLIFSVQVHSRRASPADPAARTVLQLSVCVRAPASWTAPARRTSLEWATSAACLLCCLRPSLPPIRWSNEEISYRFSFFSPEFSI